MNSYHFSLGNSTKGPIGFCARVNAKNQEEAIGRLCELLPDHIEVEIEDRGEGEYIEIYLNEAAIAKKDIDEWEKL